MHMTPMATAACTCALRARAAGHTTDTRSRNVPATEVAMCARTSHMFGVVAPTNTSAVPEIAATIITAHVIRLAERRRKRVEPQRPRALRAPRH